MIFFHLALGMQINVLVKDFPYKYSELSFLNLNLYLPIDSPCKFGFWSIVN